ncbi:40s ribosomal protein s5-1 [Hordeum vulgare]|nr:40s ribosomal protein s5-1 [Hordeum vulgare]
MREGMLHNRDVEGPKKTGSMEARLEAMEQHVFKFQGMVERGLNTNHMMIMEFTNKHKINANDIGKHLYRLYDRIDHLQAEIYDLQNQNYVVLNDASRDPTSSSIVTHFCLMAKVSKVSPTLNPNISHDDDVDDNGYENNDEESDNIASLKFKGEMIFKCLYKNKLACSKFLEIMSIATEGKKYIEELEAHLEEHEATIETMEGHERDYANETAELSQALENEQITKESLEETFAI